MRHLSWIVVILALLIRQVSLPVAAAADVVIPGTEEQTLQAAGLATDGPGLLEFFRLRARTEPDGERLATLVQQLGDPSAAVRERVAAELVTWGPLAVPHLRHAANDLDNPDAALRARKCLAFIEGTTRTAPAAASARLVALRKPDGAAEALLGYLPFADSPEVLKEIAAALSAVAFVEHKPNGAMLRALKDPMPLRRALAGVALCRREEPEQWPAVRVLLQDPKPLVRLRAGVALAEVHDAEAIPVLIELLAELPPEHRKDVDAVLIPLAGDWAPGAVAGDDNIARRIRRDAWASWWRNTDGPALLSAIRQRTLTPSGQEKVQALIRKLGDDDYETRQNAQAEVAAMGTLALPLLREAARHNDPEIARRAQDCIQEIEKDKGAALPSAAFRLLTWRKPAGAVEALLAYLPYADGETAFSDAQKALRTLASQDATPDPALMKALEDPVTVRRVLAAELLAQFGRAEHRSAVRKLLQDKDPKVRLRVSVALASIKDPEAIPALIDLIAELPSEQTWQAEEILELLAGDGAPEIVAGDSGEARKKCQESWARWWKDHGDRVDMASLEPNKRNLGRTLVSEYHTNRIVEVGTDGKPRWTLENLGGPVDAVVLPGNRVLIGEYNAKRITERDFQGKILWEKSGLAGNPVAVQRLPSGNTFVATQQHICEYDRTGKALYEWAIGKTIMGAYKGHDAHVWCLVAEGLVIEVDPSGKVINSFPSNRGGEYCCGIDLLPRSGMLIALPNVGRVAEISSSGKTLQEFAAPNVTSATTLPNGNVLASSVKDKRAFEIDRAGKIVWEYKDDHEVYVVRRR